MSATWALVNVSKKEYFLPSRIGFPISATDLGFLYHPGIALIHHLLLIRPQDYRRGQIKGVFGEDIGILGRWYGSVIVISSDEMIQDMSLADAEDLRQFQLRWGHAPVHYAELADERYVDIARLIHSAMVTFTGHDMLEKRLGLTSFDWSGASLDDE